MQTNDKLQTNHSKTLKLTNVLTLSIKAEELQNFARTVELMQNYIKSIGVLGLGAVAGMGYTVFDALVQKKGINIGVKKTSRGTIYGLDVSVK